MPAIILDGKTLAATIQGRVRQEINDLKKVRTNPPGLAVVLVGDDPASQIYVRNKRRACGELGIRSWVYELGRDTSEDKVLSLVGELNRNPDVTGILVQTPLPPQISVEKVILAIHPHKDVDGYHPHNLGLLLVGRPQLVSCTPAGILELIRSSGQELAGRRAVVVGRSNTVGKPTALLLLQEHATVTLCHSRTRNLDQECLNADILVVAIGRRHFVAGDWIKPGAVVVDVGINRDESGLCGDVDFSAAKDRAGFITPVPGGVGPMTVAMLMANTVRAFRLQEELHP